MDAFETFTSDYDTENPVTKKDGEIRMLDMRSEKNKDSMSDLEKQEI